MDSINKELQVDWNGFYSLCILYAVFSVTNFLAPSVLLHLGARISLFLSACSYLLFIFVFLYPVRHVLNIVSVVIGFGAAGLLFATSFHTLTTTNLRNQFLSFPSNLDGTGQLSDAKLHQRDAGSKHRHFLGHLSGQPFVWQSFRLF